MTAPSMVLSGVPIRTAGPGRVGAVLADHQPEEDVGVYLDPVGHPFCLFLRG